MNKASFAYNPSNQLISRVVSHEAFQIKLPSIGEAFYDVNELNQYTSVEGSALSYDLNGNLKTYDGWTYHYNAHNRLVTAVKTGTTLSLTYDAIGRLASSTLNGVQTTFLYDDNELVAEYSSTGALLRRYVHGLKEDDPLVWYEGVGTTNTRYLLPDEKGSIIAETNGSGGIVTLHRYGPFGEPQNSSTSRFRYTGQILLPGTELYYYKARVYHPKLGRFMQTDPIGYEDGMNWYAYVGNDPVNHTDPTGQEREGRFAKIAKLFCKKCGSVGDDIADAIEHGDMKRAEKLLDKHISKNKSTTDVTKKSGVPGDDFVPSPNVTEQYTRLSGAGPTAAQKASVQGKPCVDCGAITPKQVADHKDPLVVQHYREGSVNVQQQRQIEAVQPHCPACSSSQGGQLGAFGKKMKKDLGL